MIKNILSDMRKKKRRYKRKVLKYLPIFILFAAILVYGSSKIGNLSLNASQYIPKKEINLAGAMVEEGPDPPQADRGSSISQPNQKDLGEIGKETEEVIENTEEEKTEAGSSKIESRRLTGRLYFNDDLNTSFISDLILEAIENAKDSVEISMYSFRLAKLVDALKEAQREGKRVQLVLDKGKETQHEDVFGVDVGFPVIYSGGGFDKKNGLMHHKFVLLDRDSDTRQLFVGSLNYTELQEKYDPSFIFQTRNPEIIEAFKEENDLLLREIRGYKKLKEISYLPMSRKIHYSNGFMEVWFGPGFKENSVKYRILDLIDSAKKSIDVIAWRANDYDIARALLKKAESGVRVRILADDFFFWSKESVFPFLASKIKRDDIPNIEIVSDFYKTIDLKDEIQADRPYFNSYIHQHTLIIDDAIALSGTNNWTYGGFYRNDESTLVSNVNFWVEGFRDSFDLHYRDLRNKKLEVSLDGNSFTMSNASRGFIGKKLVIYNEVSEVEEIPTVCFQEKIIRTQQQFSIPETCNTEQSLIFVFDKENNVVASGYLQW